MPTSASRRVQSAARVAGGQYGSHSMAWLTTSHQPPATSHTIRDGCRVRTRCELPPTIEAIEAHSHRLGVRVNVTPAALNWARGWRPASRAKRGETRRYEWTWRLVGRDEGATPRCDGGGRPPWCCLMDDSPAAGGPHHDRDADSRAPARASVQEIKREIRSWQSGCRPGDAPCWRASHEFVARFQAHSSRGRMRRICHRGAGMGQS